MPDTYGMEAASKAILLGDSSHSILTRYLDTVGDGTGTKNMNAAAGDVYFIKPPKDRNYIIDEVSILITDNATPTPIIFGGMAGALANGILFRITSKPGASDPVVDKDLLDGLPIKKNEDLSFFGALDRWVDAATNCMIALKCNFREKGTPIVLFGHRGEALEFVTQDNMSTLTSLFVKIIGRETVNSR